MKRKKGRLYNPDKLEVLEKQIDAAHQHLRLALSIVRKLLAERK